MSGAAAESASAGPAPAKKRRCDEDSKQNLAVSSGTSAREPEAADSDAGSHQLAANAAAAVAHRLPIPAKKVKDFRIKGVWDGKEHHFGVGTGVFVTSRAHAGCVLLGLRRGSDGAGTWALPGGHLEFGESLEVTAVREVKEETGITADASSAKVVFWDNAREPSKNYHYVTAFVRCDAGDQEPQNLEPNKCDGWHWKRWDSEEDFPPLTSLFTGLRNVRQRGLSPFD